MAQESRTARIVYVYSSASGMGELPRTSTPVFVDSTSYFASNHRQAYNFALTLSHTNYLPCHFIDEDGGAMVHHPYDDTIVVYVHKLYEKNITPVMTYQIPTKHHQPFTYNYVPEIYRSLIKSMIEFVVYLHQNNKSLYSFSLDNLVVKDGVLKFWKVGFLDATPLTKINDFQCIYEVIARLFEDYPIPAVLDNLLHKMFTYASDTVEPLLLNHLSIMSSTERRSFFKNCCDKESSLSQTMKMKYTRAVENTGGNSDWTWKFRHHTYQFGPIYNCFCFAQYRDTGSDFLVNHNLLRFCRNMEEHLKDYIPSYLGTFGDLDIELMIMYVFDQKLMKFQEKLHDNGLLDHFS